MSIDYEPGRRRYRVRWREHGCQRSRRFLSRRDAEAFAASDAGGTTALAAAVPVVLFGVGLPTRHLFEPIPLGAQVASGRGASLRLRP